MRTNRRQFVSLCGAAALAAGTGAAARQGGAAGRTWPSTFPSLTQQVNGRPLAYLDSAATTLRPQSVIDAIAGFYATDNANPARVHQLAGRAADRLALARQAAARFVNAADPLEIIFVRGSTEGLNLVASTWGAVSLGKGDEVVVSVAEHYSNLMPWTRAAERAGAVVRVADVDDEGRLTVERVSAVLSPRTRLVAISHVSNVLGYLNPVKEIAAAARAAGATVVIDGAQGAPHARIDVRDIGCDFYVFSGHKLLGPMATGVVWGRRELLDRMPPFHVGSNMAHEVSLTHAELEKGALKFQAGTPDVAGPVGLAAAIAFFEQAGPGALQAHDDLLVRHGLARLKKVPGLRLIGPAGADRRVPVFTFTLPGIAAAAAAAELDRRGIAVRAGDMAALPLLKRFGVTEAVRASAYVYSTTRDLDRLGDALEQISDR
jgi:cysteine sulfinate desulfinase/cysteine desulfurase/selenocysteine lyase